MFLRGVMTPSLMPTGPDVQHMLDPSSMSVSFSLSFFVLARTAMQGAAKCEKHCELQDSVNQQEVERILLFGLFLKAACQYRKQFLIESILVTLQRAIAENIFCEYNISYIAVCVIGKYFWNIICENWDRDGTLVHEGSSCGRRLAHVIGTVLAITFHVTGTVAVESWLSLESWHLAPLSLALLFQPFPLPLTSLLFGSLSSPFPFLPTHHRAVCEPLALQHQVVLQRLVRHFLQDATDLHVVVNDLCRPAFVHGDLSVESLERPRIRCERMRENVHHRACCAHPRTRSYFRTNRRQDSWPSP